MNYEQWVNTIRQGSRIPDSKLTYIKRVGDHVSKSGRRDKKALFACDCGNTFEAVERTVRRGKAKTCGCSKFKHGLSDHPLYKIFKGMKSRCYNKNRASFKTYGANGITVCDEWIDDFKSFYDFCLANGWRKGLAVDRINTLKGYCPENVRFVTQKENNRNSTQSKKWFVHGVMYESKMQAVKKTGISEYYIRKWCNEGINNCYCENVYEDIKQIVNQAMSVELETVEG